MKIKPLTKEQLTISIDRLTRFKDPEIKYLRVFKDIITTNLINPKLKKHELDTMDYEDLKNIAEIIFNSSFSETNEDLLINQKLYDYENSLFNLNENTKKLIKNKINYKNIIKILPENIPNNLKWLKSLDNKINAEENFGYPIKTIILCEGITEEILLPKFSQICDFDFKEHGIHILSAGGKNQVV